MRSKAARAVVSAQGVCKEQRVEHQIPSRLYRHLGTDAAGGLATEESNGRHAGAGDGGCANSKPFQAAAQRWTQQLRVAFSRAPKRASTEIEMLLLSSTGDHVMLARFILIRSALQFCTWYRLPSRHVGRGVCTRGLVIRRE